MDGWLVILMFVAILAVPFSFVMAAGQNVQRNRTGRPGVVKREDGGGPVFFGNGGGGPRKQPDPDGNDGDDSGGDAGGGDGGGD